MASTLNIPWFGAKKLARELHEQVATLQSELESAHNKLRAVGAMSLIEVQERQAAVQREIAEQEVRAKETLATIEHQRREADRQLSDVRKTLVETEDMALLQESGLYRYTHPLSDAVAYQAALEKLEDEIKAMNKKDGGAVLAAKGWTVNGSEAQGRTMTRDFSKLMLRAFNAEADNLVRGLKPYKVKAAIERLEKVATTIEKLGKIMDIRIAGDYLRLRKRELMLTADFLEKQAEEKEAERVEKERLREERKVQQEIERERARLEKERQHYENALEVLEKKGDAEGVARLQQQITEIDKGIADVDYRAANIRAGYVYVISNIGSFGERMVKIGLTRRLDPLDRIKELSDASVPFNFDVHALFFSKDAVGIEMELHRRLAASRCNVVNLRREFFRASPLEVKAHMAELAGDLLEFHEIAEALEYRQGLIATQGETAVS